MEITLDQMGFANSIKPIVHSQLQHGKPEDPCNPELHKLYMSLLGAVAYLAHTRVDAIVFICALQRHTSKPQVQHVKKLDKLLRGSRPILGSLSTGASKALVEVN